MQVQEKRIRYFMPTRALSSAPDQQPQVYRTFVEYTAHPSFRNPGDALAASPPFINAHHAHSACDTSGSLISTHPAARSPCAPNSDPLLLIVAARQLYIRRLQNEMINLQSICLLVEIEALQHALNHRHTIEKLHQGTSAGPAPTKLGIAQLRSPSPNAPGIPCHD